MWWIVQIDLRLLWLSVRLFWRNEALYCSKNILKWNLKFGVNPEHLHLVVRLGSK
jgi:hypothetical protein